MQNTTDGSVTITRPGPAQEKRTVRYRYGGRSVIILLGLAAIIALAFLGRWEWASLASAVVIVVQGSVLVRYRADIRWLLGIKGKS